MSDIQVAIDRIAESRDYYWQASVYYEGDQREFFFNENWYRIFRFNPWKNFRFNYTRTVVDSVLNRLEIASILGTSDEANAAINKIWEDNDLVIDSDEIHRRALVYGDSYAIAWTNERGEVQVDYNSPLTTVVVYDNENPRLKRFAAKMWQNNYHGIGTPERVHLNMYYPDRVEKYECFGFVDNVVSASAFTLTEVVPNPWGEVPVFHFRTQKPYGRPEHYDAYGPQDAINKLIMTHIVTVDYQGAPQRYALSNSTNDFEANDYDEKLTEGENLDALKNGPGELWYLKGVTQVGQFPAADYKTFTEPVSEYVRALASLTSTPLHYFEKASIPSGESLRTAEAPLLKKVEDRQIMFGATWRDLFRFMLSIQGIVSDVEVKWVSPESLDTLDSWEVAVKKRIVGVSLLQVLLEMGYDREVADAIVESADEGLMSQGMNSSNVIAQQTGNAPMETL